MKNILVDTFDTEENQRRTEYRDTILSMLNTMNVNFIMLRSSRKTEETEFLKNQRRVASGHVLSAIATGKTISKLLNPLSICSKDALPLARTFYECMLNASFVLTDDGLRANRASQYTTYKLFRKQNQYFNLGGSKGVVKHNLGLNRENPRVEEALSVFGKKVGGGLRPCFTEDRSEKINLIRKVSKSAAVQFEGVENMSWDLASEIAHGSHFSFEVTQSDLTGSGPIYGPEEIGAFATHSIVCSVDAYLRVLRLAFGNIGALPELAEACILYFQEEVPELEDRFSKLQKTT